MLLTVLILGGVIIGAASLVSSLIIYKIRQATDVANSGKAVFAADAGVEYELLRNLKSGEGNRPCPTFKNGARFKTNVDLIEGRALSIVSIGRTSQIVRIFTQINDINENTSTSTLPTSKECF